MADKAYLERLTKELTDKGLLVRAGFVAFQRYMIPPHATADQLEDMKVAFMAGAQHLYASIMTFLEPGDEPTEKDLERMSLIHDELEAFRLEMEKKLNPKGNA